MNHANLPLFSDTPSTSYKHRTRFLNPHVSRIGRIATILALSALILIPVTACEALASFQLTGDWRLVQTEQENKERLRAIDEVTQHLRPFQQDKARSRLAERTSPPRTLSISMENALVVISSGADQIELALGGPPVKVSRNEGEASVSAKMEGPFLVITTRNGNGERTTKYRASKDRLTAEVTVTSPRLTKALKYSSTYAPAR